jgi:hypothetical protein
MAEDMTRRRALGGVGLAILGGADSAAADDKKPDPAKKDVKAAAQDPPELVNKIERIDLEAGPGTPPVHYQIKVTGSVLRQNYKNPVLIIKSTTPDAQGVLTYYFAADPPIGGAPGTAVPIEAKRYLFDLQRVKKITVVSATNEMSKNV